MSNGLCPNCGATVNVPEGVNEVQCEYCKTLVKNEEATHEFEEVSKAPYGSLLLIADTALEGGNNSEAYTYYNKVIEMSPTFADAWLKKGIAMVRMSTIGDLKISEAIGSWKAAMKWAKKPEPMKKRVALEINNVVTDFYPVLENHFLKFRTVDDALSEHLSRFITLESAMDYAVQLDKNPIIIRNAIVLCDKVLKSASGVVSQNIRENALRDLQRRSDLREIDRIGKSDFSKALSGIGGLVDILNTQESIKSTISAATYKLVKPIEALKAKYVSLLLEIDPVYKTEFEKEIEEQKKKEEEAAKRAAEKSEKEAKEQSSFRFGCAGFLIPVVLFGLIVLAAGDNAKDIPSGVVCFLWLAAIVGIFIGYFGRKNYLKSKENEAKEAENKDTKDVNAINSGDNQADNSEEKNPPNNSENSANDKKES